MVDLADQQFLWLRSPNIHIEAIRETLIHLSASMEWLAEDLEDWHEQDRMAALNVTLWRHWRNVPTHLLKERGKELYETLEIMSIPAEGWLLPVDLDILTRLAEGSGVPVPPSIFPIL